MVFNSFRTLLEINTSFDKSCVESKVGCKKNEILKNMNILFWNKGKANLTPEITKFVQNYNPTIFVIPENGEAIEKHLLS